MALPPDLATITITDTYSDLSGKPLGGTVTFTPTSQLADAAGNVVFVHQPVVAAVNASTGTFSVTLPCTDNDLQPAGWAYLVKIGVPGIGGTAFTALFPSSLGTVVRLRTVAPAVPPPPPLGTAVYSVNGMSGAVTLGAAQTSAVPLAGGTMTGPLVLSADPSVPLGAATKEYVDSHGAGGGGGTVTGVSVASANGFAGTVANASTNPAVTLETTVTGLLKGNGTGVSAAVSGADYDAPGAAATAQTAAESFATSAVALETSRAETAEGLLAPLASPALTGTPTAPTKTALTDSTALATTAYADAAVAAETSRAGTAEALKAPLASPALTGSPTAPTQTAGDSSTKIATDAFVVTAVTAETSRATTAEALALAKAGNLSDVGTRQTALNNLTGSQTAGRYLRSDGTNASLAAIQAADVPALNQNTTGTAAGLSSTLAVSSGGTGAPSVTAYAPVTGGTTSTGALQAVSNSGAATGQVLTYQGSSSIPTWTTVSGAVDTIAAHIQPLGTRSAGSQTISAASDHVHTSTLTGWAETAVTAAIASGTTTSTIAVASGNVYSLALSNTATCTFTLTTATPSGTSSSVTVYLKQDATGGRTVAWNNVTWLGAGTPVIASAASAVTAYAFESLDGGTTWYGTQVSGGPQIPIPLADLPAQASTTLGMFGDGSDSAATLDGTATVAWASGPAGNVYTMTRDAQLTALTINSGVTLIASGYRIHCQGQVSVSSGGTLSGAGKNASGSTAGGVSGSGSNGGGRAGGAGATGAGTAGQGGIGSPNGAAAGGGAGTSGAGGTAGAATSLPAGWYRQPFGVLTGIVSAFNASATLAGAPGGGGGGGDGTNAGGGGGGGGAMVIVFAYSMVNNGTMTVAGGAGGNGAGSNSGGGGGGGGGSILAYTLAPWNNSGTTTLSGGSAGTGTHANGSAGGTGSATNIVLV